MKHKKILIVIALIAAMALSIGYYYYAVQFEVNRNKLLSADYESEEYGKLYDFYVANELLTENRTYVGNPDAHVTVIPVVDFLSPQSAIAYNATMQVIDEFVTAGTVKYTHKYYLSEEEYTARTGRFIYAHAAQCYLLQREDGAAAFTMSLFTVPEDRVPELLRDAGVDPTLCDRDRELYEDAIESEFFRVLSPSIYVGIDGKNNEVLYGTPESAALRRAIRLQQIQLGI